MTTQLYDKRWNPIDTDGLDEKMLLAPLRWKKPRKIFVCSTTDLFGEWVKDEWLDRIFAVMALCPQHVFQLLTKRPKRMREYLSEPKTSRRIYNEVCDLALEHLVNVVLIAPQLGEDGAPPGPRIFLGTWPLPNVWLGVTAENQEAADARIPDLLATPAAVRFVSVEPMLGPVNLRSLSFQSGNDLPEVMRVNEEYGSIDALRGISTWPCSHYMSPTIARRAKIENGTLYESKGDNVALDWVIAGGESGPHARPSHPDWFRSLRDQCAAAGVPFFFKQWGEWDADALLYTDLQKNCPPPNMRVGKRRAGRLLDGVEHSAFPATQLKEE